MVGITTTTAVKGELRVAAIRISEAPPPSTCRPLTASLLNKIQVDSSRVNLGPKGSLLFFPKMSMGGLPSPEKSRYKRLPVAPQGSWCSQVVFGAAERGGSLILRFLIYLSDAGSQLSLSCWHRCSNFGRRGLLLLRIRLLSAGVYPAPSIEASCRASPSFRVIAVLRDAF